MKELRKPASEKFISEVSSRPLEKLELATKEANCAYSKDSLRVQRITPIMSSETKYEEVRLAHAMICFVDLTVKRRRDQDVGPVFSWRRWCDLNNLACREA